MIRVCTVSKKKIDVTFFDHLHRFAAPSPHHLPLSHHLPAPHPPCRAGALQRTGQSQPHLTHPDAHLPAQLPGACPYTTLQAYLQRENKQANKAQGQVRHAASPPSDLALVHKVVFFSVLKYVHCQCERSKSCCRSQSRSLLRQDI